MAKRLEELRKDYCQVVGEPFESFYCPVLFKDEPVPLCKAHLVNQAFPNASTKWTVQRADVDNFFGHAFEGDFVDLRHSGSSVSSFYDDPSSMKHLRPRTYVNGKLVGHYVPKGPVPPEHVEIRIPRPNRPMRLALKLQPNEMQQSERIFLEVGIEKDCRMPALVSTLKAAHLVVFEMLGYRYSLSAGGVFLGHTVLGKFFMENEGLDKQHVLANAESHFPEYANLVRPVQNPEAVTQDTVNDGIMYICEGLSRWAFLVYVRTSDMVQAAIVPLLDTPDAAAEFVNFLNGKRRIIHVRQCQFLDGVFHIAPTTEKVVWQESKFR